MIRPAHVTCSHKAPVSREILSDLPFYCTLFQTPYFIFLLTGKDKPWLHGRHPSSCLQTLPRSLTEFGLPSHSLFGGNGTQLNAKSSALPHCVLLPEISPSSLRPGFTFRLQFYIHLYQVKPRKNKGMVQIHVPKQLICSKSNLFWLV